MNAPLSVNGIAGRLRGTDKLCDAALDLSVFDWQLRIHSNNPELLQRLGEYFAHVAGPVGSPHAEIVAVECPAPDLDLPFVDWTREPGKTGRKDSYVDLRDGRLIRKVRTGMVFLQSATQRIAAGPCLRHDNQVINFINAQIMNHLQQRDWLICHAAALVRHDRAYGIAGLSGGGKSTLMLHALEYPDCKYLTNDRLFIRHTGKRVDARGIPKMPRINPGTLLHNQRLAELLSHDEQRRLRGLAQGALWELEEKHDVMITRHYGARRIAQEAQLAGFLILNWSRESRETNRIEAIDIAQRPDLLAALMKSPGPFYQYADGRFFTDDTALDSSPYLAALADIPVFEVLGGVDFDRVTQRYLELAATD